jgi:hypothetical protein
MRADLPASKRERTTRAAAASALVNTRWTVVTCMLWLLPAAFCMVAPAEAGDATHFLICRSEGCVDIPSLRFFPKGQAPATAAAPPAAGATPPATAPNQPQPDALQREIEADIVDFCEHHPDERFCGKLRLWFQRHPETRTPM